MSFTLQKQDLEQWLQKHVCELIDDQNTRPDNLDPLLHEFIVVNTLNTIVGQMKDDLRKLVLHEMDDNDEIESTHFKCVRKSRAGARRLNTDVLRNLLARKFNLSVDEVNALIDEASPAGKPTTIVTATRK